MEDSIRITESEREELYDKKVLEKKVDGIGKVVIKYHYKNVGRMNDYDLILEMGRGQSSFVKRGENIVVETYDGDRYELEFE